MSSNQSSLSLRKSDLWTWSKVSPENLYKSVEREKQIYSEHFVFPMIPLLEKIASIPVPISCIFPHNWRKSAIDVQPKLIAPLSLQQITIIFWTNSRTHRSGCIITWHRYSLGRDADEILITLMDELRKNGAFMRRPGSGFSNFLTSGYGQFQDEMRFVFIALKLEGWMVVRECCHLSHWKWTFCLKRFCR